MNCTQRLSRIKISIFFRVKVQSFVKTINHAEPLILETLSIIPFSSLESSSCGSCTAATKVPTVVIIEGTRARALYMLVTFPFFTNYCKNPQENRQFDKHSLDIDSKSFHEEYKKNERLQKIDTRTLEEYKKGHIPGALILPVRDLESSKDTSNVLPTLKKDEEVYIYIALPVVLAPKERQLYFATWVLKRRIL
jgi:hypothetical protein